MIWYDMIWWYDIWYMIWWYDMIWYDKIWYDMIWYVIVWYMILWYMIWYMIKYDVWYIWYMIWYISLIAIGLTQFCSSTVHINTQKVHRITQWIRIHSLFIIYTNADLAPDLQSNKFTNIGEENS
jgi:hypothetical protein